MPVSLLTRVPFQSVKPLPRAAGEGEAMPPSSPHTALDAYRSGNNEAAQHYGAQSLLAAVEAAKQHGMTRQLKVHVRDAVEIIGAATRRMIGRGSTSPEHRAAGELLTAMHDTHHDDQTRLLLNLRRFAEGFNPKSN